jgi:hypothetical protein
MFISPLAVRGGIFKRLARINYRQLLGIDEEPTRLRLASIKVGVSESGHPDAKHFDVSGKWVFGASRKADVKRVSISTIPNMELKTSDLAGPSRLGTPNAIRALRHKFRDGRLG